MAGMNTAAVSIQQVSFKYPAQTNYSIKQLSLVVEPGESFGLFGPNGAGKTTLMHLMTGLLLTPEGSITLLGQPVRKHDKSFTRLFGFVPQDFSFYQELTPAENL